MTLESTWFDNMTLGEIKEHFWDNLTHILKETKEYELKDKEECQRFYLQTICEIANKHGANIKTRDAKVIHRICGVHNIKIERKIAKDRWVCEECGEEFEKQLRNKVNLCYSCGAFNALKLLERADHRNDGTFIMKDNEIAGFISEPWEIVERKTKDGLIIINDGNSGKYTMKVMRKS